MVYLYRATNRNSDVWLNLSSNWDHFFWLTGEFPATLQIISDKIQSRFVRQNHRGPKGVLSYRNQVNIFEIHL